MSRKHILLMFLIYSCALFLLLCAAKFSGLGFSDHRANIVADILCLALPVIIFTCLFALQINQPRAFVQTVVILGIGLTLIIIGVMSLLGSSIGDFVLPGLVFVGLCFLLATTKIDLKQSIGLLALIATGCLSPLCILFLYQWLGHWSEALATGVDTKHDPYREMDFHGQHFVFYKDYSKEGEVDSTVYLERQVIPGVTFSKRLARFEYSNDIKMEFLPDDSIRATGLPDGGSEVVKMGGN